MKSALTIAGSDSSGGAGIQADIKTMTAFGVYAQSVITALTAQNTLGVSGVEEISPSFVREQMDRVFEDIYPDAIKIGMISSAEVVRVVAQGLRDHRASRIVLDPVMVATSGASLSSTTAISEMVSCLFPLVDVVTPNIFEAEVLAECSIASKKDMINAARAIQKKGVSAVLVKGGHFVDCVNSADNANDADGAHGAKNLNDADGANDADTANDEDSADDVLLKPDGSVVWFEQERIHTANTHGTGCTLSSAIASGLALGMDLEQAVSRAKLYLTEALRNNPNLGKGSGPLNHMWEFSDRAAAALHN